MVLTGVFGVETVVTSNGDPMGEGVIDLLHFVVVAGFDLGVLGSGLIFLATLALIKAVFLLGYLASYLSRTSNSFSRTGLGLGFSWVGGGFFSNFL